MSKIGKLIEAGLGDILSWMWHHYTRFLSKRYGK